MIRHLLNKNFYNFNIPIFNIFCHYIPSFNIFIMHFIKKFHELQQFVIRDLALDDPNQDLLSS